MKRRILSIILAVIMLLSAVAVLGSCASNNNNDDENTTTTAVNQVNSNVDENGYLRDKIPAGTNFDNKTCTILHWNDGEPSEYNPEQNVDVISDAVYERNQKVQDRLNVTIKFEGIAGAYAFVQEFADAVSNDISAGLGQSEFDIISDYGMGIGICIVKGYCENLRSFDVIDIEAPWWASDLVENGTLNGNLYFATGDISTSYLINMYSTFFNKDIITNRNFESPYDHVMNDNWTWQTFMNMCDGMYEELDNDGAPSTGDNYGLAFSSVRGESVFYSGGIQMLERDEADNLLISSSFKDTRATDFYQKMQVFMSSEDVYLTKDSNWKPIFESGRALFTIEPLNYAKSLTATAGLSFGVVPMPKYDEHQDYKSATWVGRSLYSISKGTDDSTMAATVLECLASESYRGVTDTLYERSLKVKYANDPTTATMIDLIRSSISFDLAQVFVKCFENDLPTRFPRALVCGTRAGYDGLDNFSSAYNNNEVNIKSALAQIVKAHE